MLSLSKYDTLSLFGKLRLTGLGKALLFKESFA